jgi:hypothetical protein
MGGEIDDWVRSGLAQQGVDVTEDELALIRMVHAAYEPAIGAFDAADLSAWLPEGDLDPSRAPRERA